VSRWQKYYRPIFWQQASGKKVGGNCVWEREWKNKRDGLCVCVCVCVLWIRGNELSQALSYEFSQALAPLINDTCHSVRVWQSSWEGLWCMAALQKEIKLFWHGHRPCPLYKVPAFLHGCFFFSHSFLLFFFFECEKRAFYEQGHIAEFVDWFKVCGGGITNPGQMDYG